MKQPQEGWTVYLHVLPKQISNYSHDKYYVGLTHYTLKQRSGINGQGYKSQTYFFRAIQKYGWDNFRHIILKHELSKHDAEMWEKEYIRIYDSYNKDFGYNLTKGGEGLCGFKMSEETKRKFSEIKMGANNHFFGRKHSDESKKLIKDHHADISGINNPRHKPIYRFSLNGDFIKKYDTITQAEITDGFPHQMICHCASGKHKTAYKQLWRYESDVIYSETDQTYYIIRDPYTERKKEGR